MCRHAYPQWEAVDMHAYMSSALDEAGVDLLQQLLRYNPEERISVRCPQSAALAGRGA